jgi:hypothetical protein
VRRALVLSTVAVICAGLIVAAVHKPHTAGGERFAPSSTKRHAVVWAVGDGADGGGAAKRLAGRIERARPDRFLYLGDVYESGTPSEFATNYAPTYGRLASITAPTPGNHEWPSHARGYDAYWNAITGRRIAPYYSFRLGGWRILSLNSEAPHDAHSPQLDWLRRELAGEGTCRLAFWHRPRYSAGPHGDQADVAPFWAALRGHARLVLNGHDHDLQRLEPIAGIVELVAGAGGHGHYPLDGSYRRLAFGDDSRYGALRVSLRSGAARYAFVALGGHVLDRGRLRCRR